MRRGGSRVPRGMKLETPPPLRNEDRGVGSDVRDEDVRRARSAGSVGAFVNVSNLLEHRGVVV